MRKIHALLIIYLMLTLPVVAAQQATPDVRTVDSATERFNTNTQPLSESGSTIFGIDVSTDISNSEVYEGIEADVNSQKEQQEPYIPLIPSPYGGNCANLPQMQYDQMLYEQTNPQGYTGAPSTAGGGGGGGGWRNPLEAAYDNAYAKWDHVMGNNNWMMGDTFSTDANGHFNQGVLGFFNQDIAAFGRWAQQPNLQNRAPSDFFTLGPGMTIDNTIDWFQNTGNTLGIINQGATLGYAQAIDNMGLYLGSAGNPGGQSSHQLAANGATYARQQFETTNLIPAINEGWYGGSITANDLANYRQGGAYLATLRSAQNKINEYYSNIDSLRSEMFAASQAGDTIKASLLQDQLNQLEAQQQTIQDNQKFIQEQQQMMQHIGDAMQNSPVLQQYESIVFQEWFFQQRANGINDPLSGLSGQQLIYPPDELARILGETAGGWTAERVQGELTAQQNAQRTAQEALDVYNAQIGRILEKGATAQDLKSAYDTYQKNRKTLEQKEDQIKTLLAKSGLTSGANSESIWANSKLSQDEKQALNNLLKDGSVQKLKDQMDSFSNKIALPPGQTIDEFIKNILDGSAIQQKSLDDATEKLAKINGVYMTPQQVRDQYKQFMESMKKFAKENNLDGPEKAIKYFSLKRNIDALGGRINGAIARAQALKDTFGDMITKFQAYGGWKTANGHDFSKYEKMNQQIIDKLTEFQKESDGLLTKATELKGKQEELKGKLEEAKKNGMQDKDVKEIEEELAEIEGELAEIEAQLAYLSKEGLLALIQWLNEVFLKEEWDLLKMSLTNMEPKGPTRCTEDCDAEVYAPCPDPLEDFRPEPPKEGEETSAGGGGGGGGKQPQKPQRFGQQMNPEEATDYMRSIPENSESGQDLGLNYQDGWEMKDKDGNKVDFDITYNEDGTITITIGGDEYKKEWPTDEKGEKIPKDQLKDYIYEQMLKGEGDYAYLIPKYGITEIKPPGYYDKDGKPIIVDPNCNGFFDAHKYRDCADKAKEAANKAVADSPELKKLAAEKATLDQKAADAKTAVNEAKNAKTVKDATANANNANGARDAYTAKGGKGAGKTQAQLDADKDYQALVSAADAAQTALQQATEANKPKIEAAERAQGEAEGKAAAKQKEIDALKKKTYDDAYKESMKNCEGRKGGMTEDECNEYHESMQGVGEAEMREEQKDLEQKQKEAEDSAAGKADEDSGLKERDKTIEEMEGLKEDSDYQLLQKLQELKCKQTLEETEKEIESLKPNEILTIVRSLGLTTFVDYLVGNPTLTPAEKKQYAKKIYEARQAKCQEAVKDSTGKTLTPEDYGGIISKLISKLYDENSAFRKLYDKDHDTTNFDDLIEQYKAERKKEYDKIKKQEYDKLFPPEDQARLEEITGQLKELDENKKLQEISEQITPCYERVNKVYESPLKSVDDEIAQIDQSLAGIQTIAESMGGYLGPAQEAEKADLEARKAELEAEKRKIERDKNADQKECDENAEKVIKEQIPEGTRAEIDKILENLKKMQDEILQFYLDSAKEINKIMHQMRVLEQRKVEIAELKKNLELAVEELAELKATLKDKIANKKLTPEEEDKLLRLEIAVENIQEEIEKKNAENSADIMELGYSSIDNALVNLAGRLNEIQRNIAQKQKDLDNARGQAQQRINQLISGLNLPQNVKDYAMGVYATDIGKIVEDYMTKLKDLLPKIIDAVSSTGFKIAKDGTKIYDKQQKYEFLIKGLRTLGFNVKEAPDIETMTKQARKTDATLNELNEKLEDQKKVRDKLKPEHDKLEAQLKAGKITQEKFDEQTQAYYDAGWEIFKITSDIETRERDITKEIQTGQYSTRTVPQEEMEKDSKYKEIKKRLDDQTAKKKTELDDKIAELRAKTRTDQENLQLERLLGEQKTAQSELTAIQTELNQRAEQLQLERGIQFGEHLTEEEQTLVAETTTEANEAKKKLDDAKKKLDEAQEKAKRTNNYVGEKLGGLMQRIPECTSTPIDVTTCNGKIKTAISGLNPDDQEAIGFFGITDYFTHVEDSKKHSIPDERYNNYLDAQSEYTTALQSYNALKQKLNEYQQELLNRARQSQIQFKACESGASFCESSMFQELLSQGYANAINAINQLPDYDEIPDEQETQEDYEVRVTKLDALKKEMQDLEAQIDTIRNLKLSDERKAQYMKLGQLEWDQKVIDRLSTGYWDLKIDEIKRELDSKDFEIRALQKEETDPFRALQTQLVTQDASTTQYKQTHTALKALTDNAKQAVTRMEQQRAVCANQECVDEITRQIKILEHKITHSEKLLAEGETRMLERAIYQARAQAVIQETATEKPTYSDIWDIGADIFAEALGKPLIWAFEHTFVAILNTDVWRGDVGTDSWLMKSINFFDDAIGSVFGKPQGLFDIRAHGEGADELTSHESLMQSRVDEVANRFILEMKEKGITITDENWEAQARGILDDEEMQVMETYMSTYYARDQKIKQGTYEIKDDFDIYDGLAQSAKLNGLTSMVANYYSQAAQYATDEITQQQYIQLAKEYSKKAETELKVRIAVSFIPDLILSATGIGLIKFGTKPFLMAANIATRAVTKVTSPVMRILVKPAVTAYNWAKKGQYTSKVVSLMEKTKNLLKSKMAIWDDQAKVKKLMSQYKQAQKISMEHFTTVTPAQRIAAANQAKAIGARLKEMGALKEANKVVRLKAIAKGKVADLQQDIKNINAQMKRATPDNLVPLRAQLRDAQAQLRNAQDIANGGQPWWKQPISALLRIDRNKAFAKELNTQMNVEVNKLLNLPDFDELAKTGNAAQLAQRRKAITILTQLAEASKDVEKAKNRIAITTKIKEATEGMLKGLNAQEKVIGQATRLQTENLARALDNFANAYADGRTTLKELQETIQEVQQAEKALETARARAIAGTPEIQAAAQVQQPTRPSSKLEVFGRDASGNPESWRINGQRMVKREKLHTYDPALQEIKEIPDSEHYILFKDFDPAYAVFKDGTIRKIESMQPVQGGRAVGDKLEIISTEIFTFGDEIKNPTILDEIAKGELSTKSMQDLNLLPKLPETLNELKKAEANLLDELAAQIPKEPGKRRMIAGIVPCQTMGCLQADIYDFGKIAVAKSDNLIEIAIDGKVVRTIDKTDPLFDEMAQFIATSEGKQFSPQLAQKLDLVKPTPLQAEKLAEIRRTIAELDFAKHSDEAEQILIQQELKAAKESLPTEFQAPSPNAKLTEILSTEGTTATLFTGRLPNVPDELAIKVYKSPGYGPGKFPADDWMDVLPTFKAEKEYSKLLDDWGIGPKAYGQVDVGGNPAIAFEKLDGYSFHDLKQLAKNPEALQAELKRMGTTIEELQSKIETHVQTLLDKGYIIDDFQVMVIKSTGAGRKAGDVLIVDAQTMRKINLASEVEDLNIAALKATPQRQLSLLNEQQKLIDELASQIPADLGKRRMIAGVIPCQALNCIMSDLYDFGKLTVAKSNKYIDVIVDGKIVKTVNKGDPLYDDVAEFLAESQGKNFPLPLAQKLELAKLSPTKAERLAEIQRAIEQAERAAPSAGTRIEVFGLDETGKADRWRIMDETGKAYRMSKVKGLQKINPETGLLEAIPNTEYYMISTDFTPTHAIFKDGTIREITGITRQEGGIIALDKVTGKPYRTTIEADIPIFGREIKNPTIIRDIESGGAVGDTMLFTPEVAQDLKRVLSPRIEPTITPKVELPTGNVKIEVFGRDANGVPDRWRAEGYRMGTKEAIYTIDPVTKEISKVKGSDNYILVTREGVPVHAIFRDGTIAKVEGTKEISGVIESPGGKLQRVRTTSPILGERIKNPTIMSEIEKGELSAKTLQDLKITKQAEQPTRIVRPLGEQSIILEAEQKIDNILPQHKVAIGPNGELIIGERRIILAEDLRAQTGSATYTTPDGLLHEIGLDGRVRVLQNVNGEYIAISEEFKPGLFNALKDMETSAHQAQKLRQEYHTTTRLLSEIGIETKANPATINKINELTKTAELPPIKLIPDETLEIPGNLGAPALKPDRPIPPAQTKINQLEAQIVKTPAQVKKNIAPNHFKIGENVEAKIFEVNPVSDIPAKQQKLRIYTTNGKPKDVEGVLIATKGPDGMPTPTKLVTKNGEIWTVETKTVRGFDEYGNAVDVEYTALIKKDNWFWQHSKGKQMYNEFAGLQKAASEGKLGRLSGETALRTGIIDDAATARHIDDLGRQADELAKTAGISRQLPAKAEPIIARTEKEKMLARQIYLKEMQMEAQIEKLIGKIEVRPKQITAGGKITGCFNCDLFKTYHAGDPENPYTIIRSDNTIDIVHEGVIKTYKRGDPEFQRLESVLEISNKEGFYGLPSTLALDLGMPQLSIEQATQLQILRNELNTLKNELSQLRTSRQQLHGYYESIDEIVPSMADDYIIIEPSLIPEEAVPIKPTPRLVKPGLPIEQTPAFKQLTQQIDDLRYPGLKVQDRLPDGTIVFEDGVTMKLESTPKELYMRFENDPTGGSPRLFTEHIVIRDKNGNLLYVVTNEADIAVPAGTEKGFPAFSIKQASGDTSKFWNEITGTLKGTKDHLHTAFAEAFGLSKLTPETQLKIIALEKQRDLLRTATGLDVNPQFLNKEAQSKLVNADDVAAELKSGKAILLRNQINALKGVAGDVPLEQLIVRAENQMRAGAKGMYGDIAWTEMITQFDGKIGGDLGRRFKLDWADPTTGQPLSVQLNIIGDAMGKQLQGALTKATTNKVIDDVVAELVGKAKAGDVEASNALKDPGKLMSQIGEQMSTKLAKGNFNTLSLVHLDEAGNIKVVQMGEPVIGWRYLDNGEVDVFVVGKDYRAPTGGKEIVRPVSETADVDGLLQITDGLAEQKNYFGLQFELERVLETVKSSLQRGRSMEQVQDDLLDAIIRFAGDADRYDDIAMRTLQKIDIKPRPASQAIRQQEIPKLADYGDELQLFEEIVTPEPITTRALMTMDEAVTKFTQKIEDTIRGVEPQPVLVAEEVLPEELLPVAEVPGTEIIPLEILPLTEISPLTQNRIATQTEINELLGTDVLKAETKAELGGSSGVKLIESASGEQFVLKKLAPVPMREQLSAELGMRALITDNFDSIKTANGVGFTDDLGDAYLLSEYVPNQGSSLSTITRDDLGELVIGKEISIQKLSDMFRLDKMPAAVPLTPQERADVFVLNMLFGLDDLHPLNFVKDQAGSWRIIDTELGFSPVKRSQFWTKNAPNIAGTDHFFTTRQVPWVVPGVEVSDIGTVVDFNKIQKHKTTFGAPEFKTQLRTLMENKGFSKEYIDEYMSVFEDNLSHLDEFLEQGFILQKNFLKKKIPSREYSQLYPQISETINPLPFEVGAPYAQT